MKIRAGIRQWKLEALEEHVISCGRDYKYIEVMGLGPQMIFMPPLFFCKASAYVPKKLGRHQLKMAFFFCANNCKSLIRLIHILLIKFNCDII